MASTNPPTRHALPFRLRLLISSLLGAVPLILLGLILLYSWYVNRRDGILQNNLSQAWLAAAYTQGWVEGHERTLHTLAESSEVQTGTIADKIGLIARQLRAQPEWTNLVISDAAGRIDVAGETVGANLLRPYLRPTQNPVVSNVVVIRPGLSVIVIGYPIFSNGRFAGMVAALVEPADIQRLFRQAPNSMESRISLWGADQRLIARTNIPAGHTGDQYDSPVLRRILDDGTGTLETTSPVDGARVLLGFTPVPGTPWTVVASTARQVAFAPVYRSLLLFSLLALLVVGVSIAWSIHASNRIGRQISQLAAAARSIGEGHFMQTPALPGGDELGELAVSLTKMAAGLDSLNRLKADVLTLVSHELKTPLTAMRMSLQLLKDGLVPPDDPRYHETLEIAERQTRRLQEMIDNLISVARMQAGELDVQARPAALAPIVNEAAEPYVTRAHERGVTLTIDVPPTLRAQVDAPKLMLVLSNLLDNAVKFTEHGSISLRAVARDGEAVVAITDTGRGIPPDAVPALFDRFSQAQPLLTRTTGGIGLGLWVVRAIIEAHGGHVFVESEGPGHGSTFGFTLPLA